jgi:branched-chain amino acid transport system ATP-binding protein
MTVAGRRVANPRLVAECVRVSYDGVQAIAGMSLEVMPGEVCALIGPNGSGKTTMLSVLSRLVSPLSGRLMFEGQEYSNVRPSSVSTIGIARTFQTVRLVAGLSATTNVLMGGDSKRRGLGLLESLFEFRSLRRYERDGRVNARDWLARVGLADVSERPVESLSYGQQRRAELARALMMEPSLILLDEPTAGMSEAERDEIASLLIGLASDGLSILLVEHNLRLISNISDWVYVMDLGQCIAEGPAAHVSRDSRVVSAYLGGRAS